jgi:hypothetical protein
MRTVVPRRPTPPPLVVDEVKVVAVGTAAWAVAFLVLLPFAGRLEDDGRLWWLGACGFGFVLGLIGLAYCVRRRAAIARAVAAGEQVRDR